MPMSFACTTVSETNLVSPKKTFVYCVETAKDTATVTMECE